METGHGRIQQRIERLDILTANQIAAGEVIERPVSVVKELVENAIDAGASRIKVEFREGGLSLIRVSDDGGGMDGRDLALAVARHATSKLRRIEDLDELSTLGFRGEALASIASVSSLEIETRRTGAIEGYRLLTAGMEEEAAIGLTGCPEGTGITVEHLFYNTPARLKFMKSPGYEGGLIHDLMIQTALGYPQIGFRLENEGKLLFDTADIRRTEDLVELFFGREARQALIPVEAAVSKGRLSGWVTAPPFSRGTRKGLHVFVNGRHILVRDMQWSIERAFEYLLPKGRFPLAVLHFRLPGNLLDVNVHPGKLEIRINDPDLNPSITRALKTAVSGGGPLPDASDLGAPIPAPPPARQGAEGPASPENLFTEPVRDWTPLYDLSAVGERQLDGFIRDSLGEPAGGWPSYGLDSGPSAAVRDGAGSETQPESVFADLMAKAAAAPAGTWGIQSHNQSLRALAAALRPEDFYFGPQVGFSVVGQLHATFILAEVQAGLLIVDQHVAHERILYEEAQKTGLRKEPAQMLIEPVSVNLTTGEEETLIRHILLLNDFGLIPERFGPRQYLIRSEPAGQSVDQAMFKELLEQLDNAGAASGAETARQALLVLKACKAAVKANTRLSQEEMRVLLAGLQKTEHPMTCPHGRPILYLLPYKRLIQAFGRSS